MAGRIRTIKPEMLEDAKTANLTHEQFRMFIAAILLADDVGNFRATPKLLDGAVFWGCESLEGVTNILTALARVHLVTLYLVRGQLYGHLNGWAKHQKVDKPSKAKRMPAPDDPQAALVDPDSGLLGRREEQQPSREPPVSSTNASRDPREHEPRVSRESRETLGTDPDLIPPTPTSDPDQRPASEIARARGTATVVVTDATPMGGVIDLQSRQAFGEHVDAGGNGAKIAAEGFDEGVDDPRVAKTVLGLASKADLNAYCDRDPARRRRSHFVALGQRVRRALEQSDYLLTKIGPPVSLRWLIERKQDDPMLGERRIEKLYAGDYDAGPKDPGGGQPRPQTRAERLMENALAAKTLEIAERQRARDDPEGVDSSGRWVISERVKPCERRGVA